MKKLILQIAFIFLVVAVNAQNDITTTLGASDGSSSFIVENSGNVAGLILNDNGKMASTGGVVHSAIYTNGAATYGPNTLEHFTINNNTSVDTFIKLPDGNGSTTAPTDGTIVYVIKLHTTGFLQVWDSQHTESVAVMSTGNTNGCIVQFSTSDGKWYQISMKR